MTFKRSENSKDIFIYVSPECVFNTEAYEWSQLYTQCICIQNYTSTHTETHKHTHAHTDTYIHTDIYVYAHSCAYICICV